MPEERRAADGQTENGGTAPAPHVEKAAAGQQQLRVVLDESSVRPIYANLCRASSTSEEVILDFAMNPTPLSEQNRKLEISQRVIMSHYTAKRLAQLLVATVQRHESMFGPLETDMRRRMKAGGAPQE